MAIGVSFSEWKDSVAIGAPVPCTGEDRSRIYRDGNVVRKEEAVPQGEGISRLHAIELRCRSRVCAVCGPELGYRVRSRLLETVSEWKKPYMLTLTVDRRNFEGPEEALLYVNGNRYLARLMSALGVERWLWVLEFQMRSWDERGRGWPHWHLVIDLEKVKGFVNLRKAWKLWRDKWRIGGLDLGLQKRARGKSVGYILRYITKYLVKMPTEGFPAWVMRMARIKFYQPSRTLGSITKRTERGEVKEVEVEEEEDDKPARQMRTLGERVELCGRSSSLVLYYRDSPSRYLGTIQLRPAALALAGSLGMVPRVQTRHGQSEWGKSWLAVGVRVLATETPEEVVERLRQMATKIRTACEIQSSSIEQPPHFPQGVAEMSGERVDDMQARR